MLPVVFLTRKVFISVSFSIDSYMQGMRKYLSQRNRKTEKKTFILSYSYLIRQSFKGIVLNRALPSLYEGSLEITLTVPFKPIYCIKGLYLLQ